MDEQRNGSDKNSNTAQKLCRTRGLKPFKKGHDPRRNLNGRPKSFDEVRSLAQELAHAADPRCGTAIRKVLESWRDSKEPTLQKAFVEYAFGKVPDKIEATGLENKTNLVLHFDHEKGITQS